jgi:ABC-type oligopeptide transport system ATPase subunit
MGLIFISHDLNLVRPSATASSSCMPARSMERCRPPNSDDAQRRTHPYTQGACSLLPISAELETASGPEAANHLPRPKHGCAHDHINVRNLPSIDKLNVSFGDAHVVKDSASRSKRARATARRRIRLRQIDRAARARRPEPSDWSGDIAILGKPRQPNDIRFDKAFHRAVQMVFQDPYGSLHPRRRSTTRWPSR